MPRARPGLPVQERHDGCRDCPALRRRDVAADDLETPVHCGKRRPDLVRKRGMTVHHGLVEDAFTGLACALSSTGLPALSAIPKGWRG